MFHSRDQRWLVGNRAGARRAHCQWPVGVGLWAGIQNLGDGGAAGARGTRKRDLIGLYFVSGANRRRSSVTDRSPDMLRRVRRRQTPPAAE